MARPVPRVVEDGEDGFGCYVVGAEAPHSKEAERAGFLAEPVADVGADVLCLGRADEQVENDEARDTPFGLIGARFEHVAVFVDLLAPAGDVRFRPPIGFEHEVRSVYGKQFVGPHIAVGGGEVKRLLVENIPARLKGKPAPLAADLDRCNEIGNH